jgi:dephospho-CoA kinase
LVRAKQNQFRAEAERSGAAIAVLDIPLLFETGGDARVDATVVVTAPLDIQRSRLLERPGMTAEKIEGMLARQMPDSEKQRRADFVIDTSRGFDVARTEVRNMLQQIREHGLPRRAD